MSCFIWNLPICKYNHFRCLTASTVFLRLKDGDFPFQKPKSKYVLDDGSR